MTADLSQKIALLQQNLSDHRAERATIQQAYAAIPVSGRTPRATTELAAQRDGLARQVSALDQAIADLESALGQARTEQAAANAEQALLDEEAFLTGGDAIAAALAAELALAVANVEAVLQKIGNALPACDEAWRAKLRREADGAAYPTDQHKISEMAKISASGFMTGHMVWQLPALTQAPEGSRSRWALGYGPTVNLMPPAPTYARSFGGAVSGGNNYKLASEVLKQKPKLTPEQKASLTPGQQFLIEQGFVGPDVAAATARAEHVARQGRRSSIRRRG